MLVTSLARAVAACTAAGAFAIAGAAPALAVPADPGAACACGGARVAEPPARLFTRGTDVAAPDQQSPVTAERRPIAVPAPDGPRVPATLSPERRAAIAQNADFQWDDAALGAGGTLAIVLAATGGAVLLRRRRPAGRRPPAPARSGRCRPSSTERPTRGGGRSRPSPPRLSADPRPSPRAGATPRPAR
jgi:hypothetical protein